MVCSRCKMVVKDELIKFGLHPTSVELGEVEVTEELNQEEKNKLNRTLLSFGFDLIDDKKSRIKEKIKSEVLSIVRSDERLKINFSQR